MSDSDNSDLSEEDKRFLESDFAKDLLASPSFRRMLENQTRAEDIARAAVRGLTLEEQDAWDEAHREQAKAVSDEAERAKVNTAQPPKVPEMDVPTPNKWLPIQVSFVEKVQNAVDNFRVHQTARAHLVKMALADALEPMQDKAKAVVQKTVDVKTVESGDDSEFVRSPTMARFFKDAERFQGHFAWIGKMLSTWPTVLLFATCGWAGGLTAMQMDQVLLAIAFFFFAFFVVTVKAIASVKDRERSMLIALMAVIVFVLHILWVLYTHRHIVAAKSGL